tara:strand:- start:968 stop:1141 length:174 start_codon:yes stop_codon:yes gene_type:complete
MITRQLFSHMLEREKILQEKLKTLEAENLKLKRGKLFEQPPSLLDHDAEFTTRKVYE